MPLTSASGGGGLDAAFKVAGNDALDGRFLEGLGDGFGLAVTVFVEFNVGVALGSSTRIPLGLTVADEEEAHSVYYIALTGGASVKSGDSNAPRCRRVEFLAGFGDSDVSDLENANGGGGDGVALDLHDVALGVEFLNDAHAEVFSVLMGEAAEESVVAGGADDADGRGVADIHGVGDLFFGNRAVGDDVEFAAGDLAVVGEVLVGETEAAAKTGSLDHDVGELDGVVFTGFEEFDPARAALSVADKGGEGVGELDGFGADGPALKF